MNTWEVYLNGNHIDTVYYDDDCDAEYVRDGLISHDGYNPNIRIYRCRLNARTSKTD